MPFIMGRVLDFDPKVSDLRLFKGSNIQEGDGKRMNDYINNIKSHLSDPTVKMVTGFINMGVPMIPFPRVEDCLGLEPKDSHMEIKDGQAIMAFDYNVKKSY